MRKLVALVAILATTPAIAQSVEEGANHCWLPPSGYDGDARIVLDVQLDAMGKVEDINAIEYEPDGQAGRDIAVSASRAIEACSPYDGTGIVRVEMELSGGQPGKASAPIDPFKAN